MFKPSPYVSYSAGNFVSSIGIWMQRVTIGWLAWELTHMASWVAAVGAADLAAGLALAPIAGLVADSRNPFHVIRACVSTSMLLAVVLSGVSAAGGLSIAALLAFTLTGACVDAIGQPARMSVVALLAGPDHMSRAVASNSIAFNLARTVGPAIAGVALAHGVPWAAFLGVAAANGVMLTNIWLLRRHLDRPPNIQRRHFLGSMGETGRYLSETPAIAVLFVWLGATAVLARPFCELMPALVGQVLHGDAGMLAAMLTAQGVGALAGGLLMLRGWSARRVAEMTFAMTIGLSLSLMSFVESGSYAAAVAAMVAVGLSHCLITMGLQILIQLRVRPSLRGRILSLYGITFRGGPALGALAFGLVSDGLGCDLRWVVLAGAVAAVVVIVALGLFNRHLFEGGVHRWQPGE